MNGTIQLISVENEVLDGPSVLGFAFPLPLPSAAATTRPTSSALSPPRGR